jgi:phosphoribosylformimino-5-aminoimidazole carboxamide ribotide isomerase
MKIVPSIDLLDGKVVRLKQGNPDLATFYDYNPVELVKKWQEIGISRLHIVDLDATLERGNNYELIKRISESTDIEIQVGGGIRDVDYAKKISENVSKIVIGTVAINNRLLFEGIWKEVGGSKIILSLDYTDNQIMVNGWRDEGRLSIHQAIRNWSYNCRNYGIDTMLLTAIKKDGMLEGPDMETLTKIRKDMDTNYNPSIQIQASGGISSIDDIKKVKEIGVEYVILGRALHSKIITIEQAITLED